MYNSHNIFRTHTRARAFSDRSEHRPSRAIGDFASSTEPFLRSAELRIITSFVLLIDKKDDDKKERAATSKRSNSSVYLNGCNRYSIIAHLSLHLSFSLSYANPMQIPCRSHRFRVATTREKTRSRVRAVPDSISGWNASPLSPRHSERNATSLKAVSVPPSTQVYPETNITIPNTGRLHKYTIATNNRASHCETLRPQVISRSTNRALYHDEKCALTRRIGRYDLSLKMRTWRECDSLANPPNSSSKLWNCVPEIASTRMRLATRDSWPILDQYRRESRKQ